MVSPVMVFPGPHLPLSSLTAQKGGRKERGIEDGLPSSPVARIPHTLKLFHTHLPYKKFFTQAGIRTKGR